MLQKIKTGCFFLKYSLMKPDALRQYRQMRQDQYRTAEEIEEISWNRTRKLLSYAYIHVPFYRERFDRLGLHPEDIKKPGDYAEIPCLTRQDLMGHFENLVSDEARPSDLQLSTTGGSSGMPVKVYHQKNVVRAAAGWRMMNWWHLPPDCNSASVYRALSTSRKDRLSDFLRWYPTRRLLLNATSFTEDDIAIFLSRFNRLRPPLLHGYVGALDAVAEYILKNGLAVHSPCAIWCTSAPITPVQQQKIESAFHAPVYDQYGCCEIYWLAAECPARRGLHMFYDIRRIEFLNDCNQPVADGEYGDIAVTDLQNYYFPLIRYRNGDRGRRLRESCTCGCNLPLMDKVKGRISESFRFPSGMRLNGEFLTTLFDHCPEAVREFRVHQKADYSIAILVVMNPAVPDAQAICEQVRQNLSEAVRREVPVTLCSAEKIDQTGGKLCFISSEISK